MRTAEGPLRGASIPPSWILSLSLKCLMALSGFADEGESRTGGGAGAGIEPETESWSEAVENAGRIHYEPDHPWMQEFWLLGRYHGQFYTVDGPTNDIDGWEHRRFRMGAQGRFF